MSKCFFAYRLRNVGVQVNDPLDGLGFHIYHCDAILTGIERVELADIIVGKHEIGEIPIQTDDLLQEAVVAQIIDADETSVEMGYVEVILLRLVDQANGIYSRKLAWFKSDGFDHVSERDRLLDGVCDGIDDEDQIRGSSKEPF